MENPQRLLWCVGGVVLGIVLAVAYDFERFIPIGVSFGLLCFTCGILLMQVFNLRRQEQKFNDETLNLMNEIIKLNKERMEWRAEKAALEDNSESDA
jgi:hypothetical protein